jgi:hypothetical protein
MIKSPPDPIWLDEVENVEKVSFISYLVRGVASVMP